MAALGAHRAQHADLLASFNHAQGEGIDDAQDRDDHSQRQQRVEDGEHLVNHAGGLACEFLAGAHLHHDEVLDGLLQVGAQLLLVIAFLRVHVDQHDVEASRVDDLCCRGGGDS